MVSDDFKQQLIERLNNANNMIPPLLLKFCKKLDYAKDVCEGNLYSNTPQYFRDLEIKIGEHGQGDSQELISEIEVQKVYVYDENGYFVGKAEYGKQKMQYASDSNVPIVSFVGVETSQMIITGYNTNQLKLRFPFSQEEYDRFTAKFGKYCVLISSSELIEALDDYNKKNRYCQMLKPVVYCRSNQSERIKAFEEGSLDRFFFKDEDFAYQREYRLVIRQKVPEDHFIRLGKLTGAIINSNELSSIEIQINFKNELITTSILKG